MTTATILTSLVGDDGEHYSSAQKSGAITVAQTYLGTSDGDSNAKDTATAMLAVAILLNRKKMGGSDAMRLESLVTDEIRALLAEEEKATKYKIIHYKTPDVDWRT